jgi:hypothetical protein
VVVLVVEEEEEWRGRCYYFDTMVVSIFLRLSRSFCFLLLVVGGSFRADWRAKDVLIFQLCSRHSSAHLYNRVYNTIFVYLRKHIKF